MENEQLAPQSEPLPQQVEVGEAFSWGWNTFKKDIGYFLVLSIIFIVVASISGWGGDKRGMWEISNPFWSLVGWLLSALVTAGMTRIVLDYYRGTKRQITDIFTQTKYFFNVLIAQLIVGILIFVGFLLLIIPGIYLAIRFMFVVDLIVDRDMTITDAMSASGKMTEGIKFDLFWFGLASFGVFLLGIIAFGVGVFVAAPVVWLASIWIYMRLKENPEMPQPLQDMESTVAKTPRPE